MSDVYLSLVLSGQRSRAEEKDKCDEQVDGRIDEVSDVVFAQLAASSQSTHHQQIPKNVNAVRRGTSSLHYRHSKGVHFVFAHSLDIT